MQQIEKRKVKELRLNPNNPRVIKDDKFSKLVQSIKEFPEMLNIRPIILDENDEVLGGNMRLRALQEAGVKEVATIKVINLTEEQKKEFIIKDNLSYGEWDWDILANEWDEIDLSNWGLDLKAFTEIPITGDDDNKSNNPKVTDDDYSVFELVMLHENKLKLLDVLNQVKQNYLFEKQEEALMEIIRKYETGK